MKLNLILSLTILVASILYAISQVITIRKERKITDSGFENVVFDNTMLKAFAEDTRINQGEPFDPSKLLENANSVSVRSLSKTTFGKFSGLKKDIDVSI